MDVNELSFLAIGCALKVHKNLGPGLLESVYEACLAIELEKIGLSFQTQVPIEIHYEGTPLGLFYRADLVVENLLLIELKSIEKVVPLHHNQTITYMRFGGWKLGLLINFNTNLLRTGIRRFIIN